MGRTLEFLSKKEVEPKTIFNNRFVVEVAECFHVHYRNLRIIMSTSDWISMARGMADAIKRWENLGCPEPQEMKHIELCRKEVASSPLGDNAIKINLNKNLYLENDGKIFAEGAQFEDEKYCHLKIRDLRIEMSLSELKQLTEAVKEAESALCTA